MGNVRIENRDMEGDPYMLCVYVGYNAYAVTAEDSETTAELCKKNLRRLAQNLGNIASTKAEQYQKLYAHKEDLSH
jgi:hypothetical protein